MRELSARFVGVFEAGWWPEAVPCFWPAPIPPYETNVLPRESQCDFQRQEHAGDAIGRRMSSRSFQLEIMNDRKQTAFSPLGMCRTEKLAWACDFVTNRQPVRRQRTFQCRI